MLLILLLQLLLLKITYDLIVFTQSIYYKFKIINLLENIHSKDDFIYMSYKDYVHVVAEIFKRKGFKVSHTNLCGEESNGLILNNNLFVEVCKNSFHHQMEMETAMKFTRRMELGAISRGMLITLGDFKDSTRSYCFKNVIDCVNCDRLMQMCKQVQHKDKMFLPN